jgi:PPK2 family polyphosphate:nucleotide phosphotransferase
VDARLAPVEDAPSGAGAAGAAMHDLSDARKLSRRHRVDGGRRPHLARLDPADLGPLAHEDEAAARELTRLATDRIAQLQDALYAEGRSALLVVIQGMDASGKDSAIRAVFSGVNPQGCQVVSFKQPSDEELDHDWLWRCARALPRRGCIGVFNRSHYEEVLIARVHADVLAAERLPAGCVSPRLWRERFADIRGFEDYLARQGVVVRKFFLHLSKDEQRRRLLARMEAPDKRWKARAGDVALRAHWGAYQGAYQDAIRATATPRAPWYVVPADHKWYARLVIAAAVVDALEEIAPVYPKPSAAEARALAVARRALAREGQR